MAEAAGAFRHVRASEKHALGNGRIRQLPARRPAGYCGVRIRCCPGSSGAGGPCRGLVLRERIRIRAVAGVRPGWSANAGCGRRLVRPARRPDGHPCSGLAADQPQRQQRDGRVRRGYPPCHPGTRPDMAGRQRQPVPMSRPAHSLPGAWSLGRTGGGTSQTARARPWTARSRPSASAAVRFLAFDAKPGTKACSPIGLGGEVSSVCIVAAAWSVRSFHCSIFPAGDERLLDGLPGNAGRVLGLDLDAYHVSTFRVGLRAVKGMPYRWRSVIGSPGSASRTAAGPGETSALRSELGITGLGASAAWPCPGRRDPWARPSCRDRPDPAAG